MLFFKVIFVAIFYNNVCLCADVRYIFKSMSSVFGASIVECQNEMNFPEEIYSEFFAYWDMSRALTDAALGCVVRCMLMKLKLVDKEAVLQEANFRAFVKAQGADDKIASHVIKLFKLCRSAITQRDPCVTALELAKCFRAGVHQMRWTPSLDQEYGEYDF